MRYACYIAPLLCGFICIGCDFTKPSERMLERGDSLARHDIQKRDSQTVAVVNDEVITLDAFQRRIDDLPSFARARLASVDQRTQFLDSLIQFELLADEAERRGLGDSPRAFTAMKSAMARLFTDEVLSSRVRLEDVSPAEIQAYYDSNRSLFEQPPARRALLLLADSPDEARRIRSDFIASAPPEPPERLIELRRLIARLTIDRAMGSRGGDAGWIDHPDHIDAPDALSQQIFSLDAPGDLTAPFPFDDHWAIASYFEDRPATTQPLDDVRDSIRESILQQKRQQARQQWLDELRRHEDLRVHDSALRSIATPAPSAPFNPDDIPTTPNRVLPTPSASTPPGTNP